MSDSNEDFKKREQAFRGLLIELCTKYEIDIIPTWQKTAINQATAMISFVDTKDNSKKVDVAVN